jgi:hypothetical protein
MQIRIGLEQNVEEGRFLAYALDFPGCFAYGEDEAETLIRMPMAVLNYDKWIRDHTSDPWAEFTDLDFRIVERFTTFNLDEHYQLTAAGQGYQVNAWFTDDWRPLSEDDIAQALKIYHWQRDELLAGYTTLAPDILEMQRPGQRWNIKGIVKHVANAEHWYLTRLGLTNLTRTDFAANPAERLDQIAAEVDRAFPTLPGKTDVRGLEGEFWSPRKIVRRTLWHQRDHIEHIKQLVFSGNDDN